MVNQNYAQRLQQWIESEAPREVRGSLANLHRRFIAAAQALNENPLSLENIRLWREGLLKQELEGRSLRQLAKVRGETIPQTEAWLKGQEQPEPGSPKESEALAYIQSASLAQSMRMLEAVVARLKVLSAQGFSRENGLTRLLQNLRDRFGLEAMLQEWVDGVEPGAQQRLEQMIAGAHRVDPMEEMGEVADMVRRLLPAKERKNYTAEYLVMLQNTPLSELQPRPERDQHPNGKGAH